MCLRAKGNGRSGTRHLNAGSIEGDVDLYLVDCDLVRQLDLPWGPFSMQRGI